MLTQQIPQNETCCRGNYFNHSAEVFYVSICWDPGIFLLFNTFDNYATYSKKKNAVTTHVALRKVFCNLDLSNICVNHDESFGKSVFMSGLCFLGGVVQDRSSDEPQDFHEISDACTEQWDRQTAPTVEEQSPLIKFYLFIYFLIIFSGSSLGWYVIGLDRSNFQEAFESSSVFVVWECPERAVLPQRNGQTSRLLKIHALISCLVRRRTTALHVMLCCTFDLPQG